MPKLSDYYTSRKPSDNRMAQMEFVKRTDNVKAINVSVWNVSLPMHPKMQERMFNLKSENSPFKNWEVKYTQTVWLKETQDAFKNILSANWYDTSKLNIQITDWGSLAMELVVLWLADPNSNPIMLIDAVYTNYLMLAKRTCRKTISIQRKLSDDWIFSFPSESEIEEFIQKNNPTSIIIIPYDNPTWQLYDRETLIMIAKLCVKYDLRLVSDEAYRELHYKWDKAVSVWSITNNEVPGIQWRRISIESASKVRNACGLRIGALITDNLEFHEKSVAEQTATLCAGTINQYIFWAIAHETPESLQKRYQEQRNYYGTMIKRVESDFKKLLPWIIVASPDAAIYTVVDVRKIVKLWFNGKDFALFCAKEWNVDWYTVLISPLSWFYQTTDFNPGITQFRIAFVENPETMQKVPYLFAKLLENYENNR